jgi:hypothetical protein
MQQWRLARLVNRRVITAEPAAMANKQRAPGRRIAVPGPGHLRP